MEGSTSPGQQLGRYQQVATLGQGGMGTVYLALASGFGQFRKLLVIKELRQDLIRQKGFIRLFMDEAKLAARLSHPNVVQTFEAFQDGNRYLLAMEYLDGQALSALIARTASGAPPRLSLGMHIHILCEVLAGLHYAHQLRDFDGTDLHVVHRDVSPQNVFLTYHGEVKVVDFGVAKAANAATSTAPGVFVGKFGYAAPEQILGRPVDARTDVFAVGVMLWQAIAQRRFSTASPTPEAFRARAQGAEPRIRALIPDVDRKLADICDRAMAVDPDQRFGTADEMRAALQDYLESNGIRIHDADIGQLMQQVFEDERQALHAQIEAAVQVSGTQSNVESLPFLTVDREPTAVADLSNLVDVSSQRDEHKIQLAYASTKVTRLPSGSTHIPIETEGATARRVLWASAALVGFAVLGALYWSSRGDDQARVEPTPLPPAPTVKFDARPPEASSTVAAKAVEAPARAPVDPEPARTVTPPKVVAPAAPTPRPNPTPVRRSRPRETVARVEPPTPPAPPAPTPQPEAPASAPKPEITAQPGRVEAGSDLGNTRRTAPARLDLENPYQ